MPGNTRRARHKMRFNEYGPNFDLLLDQGLADEVVLINYPVLLGRGKRLLSDSIDARELAFVDSKTTPTGLLINTYKHLRALKK